MKDVTVIILAAGKSSRCWPLGDKNLLSFFGKPLINYQIEKLKSLGFGRIVLVLNENNYKHLEKMGVEKVIQKGDGQQSAILSCRDKIKSGPALVVNANDFYDDELFEKMVKEIDKGDDDLILVGKKMEDYFPGGYMVKDEEGYLKTIIEKPGEGNEPSNLVRIVTDYFKDISDYYQICNGERKDCLYEVTLQKMADEKKVRVLTYDGYWGYLKYPWHVLMLTEHFLKGVKRKISKDANVSDKAIILGEVEIASGVRVFENAKIVGPCYIGENTVIGNNVILRRSIVEKECVLGYSTDMARSYIGPNCWFHSNYVGDSVLAGEVSFGAGTVFANLRLDEREIGSVIKGGKINTKMTKYGGVIGSGVRVGVNCSIMPGVKIGQGSFIGAHVLVDRDIADRKYVGVLQKQEILKNRTKVDIQERNRYKEKI